MVKGRVYGSVFCYSKYMNDLSTHGIVALVRNSEGKFLLLEDARDEMLGHWAPPHGRYETSDDSEAAGVIREVYEETKLHVTPIKSVLTQPADTKVKTVSFWLVETEESDIELDDESSDCGWFSVEETLQLRLYPGTKIFFDKVMSGEISLD